MPQVNAMTLATVSPAGRPATRIVLLKGVDDLGFVFFTNYQSRKGRRAFRQPGGIAALPLDRAGTRGAQRRTRRTSKREELDDYFASRPLAAAMQRSLHREAIRRESLRARSAFIAPSDNSAPIRRGLRTGAAIGWSLMQASYGRDARTACTTACSTRAQRRLDDRPARSIVAARTLRSCV